MQIWCSVQFSALSFAAISCSVEIAFLFASPSYFFCLVFLFALFLELSTLWILCILAERLVGHVQQCCGRTLNLTLCSNFAVNRKICHAPKLVIAMPPHPYPTLCVLYACGKSFAYVLQLPFRACWPKSFRCRFSLRAFAARAEKEMCNSSRFGAGIGAGAKKKSVAYFCALYKFRLLRHVWRPARQPACNSVQSSINWLPSCLSLFCY